MLRRSMSRWRRISYVTDVEGDFDYFKRFVRLSRVVQWESVASDGATATGRSTAASSTAAAATDVRRLGCRLTFRDATSHFVFGGDAFDHGADITFGAVLLDFKRRFPSRVHLVLGNRDVNKMVLYPRMACEVAGMTADAAEECAFRLPLPPPPSEGGAAAAEVRALPQRVRYCDYLQQQRPGQPQRTGCATAPPEAGASGGGGDDSVRRADATTFLQWALHYKLGAPGAFEHRRRELQEMATTVAGSVSDDDVAASFFAAAQSGGVYHDYLRAGVLSVVLDGVLFLHGGVNGNNAGCVPSLSATSYAEQLAEGQWWLPAVAQDAGARSTTATAATASALDWLAALESFKEAALTEWVTGTATRGEALRAYVYPRSIARHSIAVGTVMDVDGPCYTPLPVVAYLLESGIHTVCGGHQPVGDTPAIVRQPGGLVVVDADNSYSGRGNALCSPTNQRGAAAMELLFDHADDGAPASLVVHGYRADGTPFEFDVYSDPRLGRHVGDGWWVRLPPTATREGLYELRRTHDGFRHEETQHATAADVDERLRQLAASRQGSVAGELAPCFTKEELAEVRVHRLKTKITRT
ncbi:hypothetical protein NESM_000577300 [Novymonas esmeraldas]|uniref:Calcineurin-like phosphoesterase domain-containing protein n=1 Tax=Novymonas esmeraldas TaxID=1808958 RepID=A0AAW0EQT9_9TRYP